MRSAAAAGAAVSTGGQRVWVSVWQRVWVSVWQRVWVSVWKEEEKGKGKASPLTGI